MPSKSEIEFCEMWTECGVGTDAPSRQVAAWVIPRRHIPGVGCGDWERAGLLHRDTLDEPWHITGIGADLVASYESAVSLGLEIVPDPGPEYMRPWHVETSGRQTEHVVCDCDDGFIGVPVQYSEAGGIVQVWPAKCPKCNVDRGQPGVDLVWEPMLETEAVLDIGRPLAGLGEGWQSLTAELAQTLEGKVIEFRVAGRTDLWTTTAGACESCRVLIIDPVMIGSSTTSGLFIPTGFEIRLVGSSTPDGWRELTRAEGERLAGKHFEARRDVDEPPRRHVATSAQPDARAGFLRLEGGGAMRYDGTWWVRDAESAEAWITEPAAMMALLEEARLYVFEVEVRAKSGASSCLMKELGSVGRVSTTDESEMPVEINGVWCAIDGHVTELGDTYDETYSDPVLTAVRRAKTGGRHGAA